MSVSFEDCVKGCLMGVRIGDALGMPFEGLDAHEIHTLCPNGVRDFHQPTHVVFEEMRSLQPGDYTDDWQLTRAGCHSIIECKGFDLKHLARKYVEEYHRSKIGWGATTADAIKKMALWFETEGAEGRAPDVAVAPMEGRGIGNGVAIRIAPFALFCATQYASVFGLYSVETHLEKIIWSDGQMTHADPRATSGAYALANLTARLIHHQDEPIADRKQLYDLIEFVIDLTHRFERRHEDAFTKIQWNDRFTYRLRHMQEQFLLSKNFIPTTKRLRENLGTSCLTLESVPFSIAMFLQYPTDFEKALQATVEAGGDTDSNAAMVGSLVGANIGIQGIPEKWRNFRPDFLEAERLAEQLLEVL